MQTVQQNNDPAKEKHQSPVVFAAILLAGIVVLSVIFNFIAGGRFLAPSNIKLIISYTVWPTFVAWGLCFLFACGIRTCPSAPRARLFRDDDLRQLAGLPGVIWAACCRDAGCIH